MKARARLLLILSSIVVLVGAVLWLFVGPTIARAGLVPPSGEDKWSFFQAYAWLSGSPPVTETFWVGVWVNRIGLIVSVAGIVGVAVALVRAKSQTQA